MVVVGYIEQKEKLKINFYFRVCPKNIKQIKKENKLKTNIANKFFPYLGKKKNSWGSVKKHVGLMTEGDGASHPPVIKNGQNKNLYD